jgi:hypothetical protein
VVVYLNFHVEKYMTWWFCQIIFMTVNLSRVRFLQFHSKQTSIIVMCLIVTNSGQSLPYVSEIKMNRDLYS